jgi:hypothetical protein
MAKPTLFELHWLMIRPLESNLGNLPGPIFMVRCGVKMKKTPEQSREEARKRTALAKEIDAEIQQIVKTIDRSWVKLGKLCLRCREEGLYNNLGFERFDEWMESRLGRSRSQSYQAMQVIEELEGDVPLSVITDMPLQSASVLTKVPKKNRKVLAKMATEQTAQEFVKTVNRTVPNLHLEETANFQIWAEASLVFSANELVKKIQAKFGCSRAGALEWLVATGVREIEGEDGEDVPAERTEQRVN